MKKHKILLILIAVFAISGLFLLKPKKQISAGNLTNASATLSNSRISYYGKVDGGHSAADTTIKVQSSGNADNDTWGLFPGDTVSVGPNGTMTIGSIIDANNVALTTGLTVGASNGDAIYATHSGTLTISFGIGSTVPANGYVLVTIPAPAADGNDGTPDTAASTALNGFDLNTMANTDIGTTGGTGCTWGTETTTAGSGSSNHTYKVVSTSACTGTVTITFDGATKDLVNPAPVGTAHARGAADEYSITIATYDSADQEIDTVNVMVAPVDAVLVSATVQETLSFLVELRAIGSTSCGKGASVASTAYSIPWLTLSAADTFYDTAQKLTVSTNADAGYAVTIEENDQMGKNGGACSGADAGEALNCIEDTTCDGGSCSESSEDDWETASNNGLGFSLQNFSGSDAAFKYNVVSGGCEGTAETDFCARQIADMAASETKANIMSNTAPVSGSSVYVCYRISVSATQPAGYYYNNVKYTCTATF